jgi:hypothetical protein
MPDILPALFPEHFSKASADVVRIIGSLELITSQVGSSGHYQTLIL